MKKIVLRYAGGGGDPRRGAIVFGEGSIQVVWILLFSLLYLLRDLAGVGFPDIVFSGLCAVIFFLVDTGTALGLYIFTTALTVPHNEIAIFYVIIMLVKLYMERKWHFQVPLFLATIGILILQLLNMILFSELALAEFAYDYVVRMLPMLLPLFWYSAEFSRKALRNAMLCYVVGVVIGGTVVLILTGNDLGWEALLQGQGMARLGITTTETTINMQTTYNANQLAGMFDVVSAIVLIFMDKKWMPKIIGWLLIGYSFFIILLTRSRMGLLALVLALLIYYWIVIFRKKKPLQGIVMFVVALGVIGVVIQLFPEILQGALSRFINQEDITGGRSELFALYMSAWSDNLWSLLFGYGIGSYQNVVDIWDVPHNSISDILICWGLIGFVLVVITLYTLFRYGKKGVDKKWRLLAFLPAIIALAASMAGQYLTTGSPHVRLCFLLLAAKVLSENFDERLSAGEDRANAA